MTEHRHLPAKILIQQLMLGRRIDPLLAADHVGDLHQMIVHHVGEMIGRQAVGFKQDLRVDHTPVKLNGAAKHILNSADTLPLRHHHADDVVVSRSLARRLLVVREHQVSGLQRRRLPRLPAGLTQRIQLVRRAVAHECMSSLNQLPSIAAVDIGTLTLTIRAHWAANIGALIPIQTEPPK